MQWGTDEASTFLDSQKVLRHTEKDSDGNIQSGPEKLKKIIQDMAKNKSGFFEGVGELVGAAKKVDGQRALLRPGQLVFGTVSVAHAANKEESWQGPLINLLAPVIMIKKTGNWRQFPYLHVAIYAGEFEGDHYVIENGGAEPQCGKRRLV